MGVDAEMFVKVRAPLAARRVKRLAYEMAEAFGPDKFFIARGDDMGGYVSRALAEVKEYEQDGPTLRPKDGEQFLRVHLWTRYYGEGYERGNLPLIIMVAEWLEHRIIQEPGVRSLEVWYGGDSSGICASRFDAKARLALFKHFVNQGHAPYHAGWGTTPGLSRDCKFCEEPMRQTMWGGNDTGGFYCAGCGLYEVTRDRGCTWAKEKAA